MKNFYKKDGISRVYAEVGKKRFMQWFNSELTELENVPEVALCDEIFLNDEPDFAHKIDELNKLKIGESCIVEENMCIITRVR